MPVAHSDLKSSDLIIAVKESEHRPLLRALFPDWEEQVEYWEIHDLDCAAPDEALPILQQHVDTLWSRIKASLNADEG